MGIQFDALSKPERAAIADYVRLRFEALVTAQPETYIARNAKADPARWQDGVRELIAADPKRVKAIMEEAARKSRENEHGFTLIELSIVLVIIGLIVGGVLVGQSLVSAAGVRAQISQIEKFQTAANTFYEKYGYLPGDIPARPAAQFGFAARGQYIGEGDGNGVIQGVYINGGSAYSGQYQTIGETVMFWVDLSKANLIEGGFNTASSTANPNCTGLNTDSYLPRARLGSSNYILVWSQGVTGAIIPPNYFMLEGITQVCDYGNSATPDTFKGLTVAQASAMDSKVDDGLPQTGNVLAIGMSGAWITGGSWNNGLIDAPFTTASAGSSTTCTDNSATSNGTPGVSGAVQHYSVEISNGSNVNCNLAFKMQAGD